MDVDVIKVAQSAIARALRGLVRLGLRAGVSAADFEEIVREVYFRCARDDYGIRNRPTNLARVAVLTGLSRKECARLKRKTEDDADKGLQGRGRSSMNPATRVMSVWSTDERFSEKGDPQPLPAQGESGSLSALIAEHVGDIPQGAVIAELNRVGALETQANGLVMLKRRSFLPAGFNEEKLRILANQYEDLGSTVIFNLDDVDQPRMQRYVVNDAIPADRVKEFQELATALGQALLERLDDWLSDCQVTNEDPDQNVRTVRTGLGMYFFKTE